MPSIIDKWANVFPPFWFVQFVGAKVLKSREFSLKHHVCKNFLCFWEIKSMWNPVERYLLYQFIKGIRTVCFLPLSGNQKAHQKIFPIIEWVRLNLVDESFWKIEVRNVTEMCGWKGCHLSSHPLNNSNCSIPSLWTSLPAVALHYPESREIANVDHGLEGTWIVEKIEINRIRETLYLFIVVHREL